jgi:hypothetical protein
LQLHLDSFRCIMAAPAASALWITPAIAASFRFI